MKKIVRLLSLLLGLAVALAGITALCVKIFLPAEKAKALIQTQLESRLHRQVELGTVSVGFFSGFQIDGFKLSERPDFQAGTFISSDRFSVHVNWPALLFKKIILHSLELKKPTVNIIRLADAKTFNFSDLMPAESTTTQAVSAPAETSAVSLLIVKAFLTDGHVSFIDRSPKNQSTTIESLNLTVRNIGLTAPLDLKGGCKIKTMGKIFLIDIDANATMKGDTILKRASIESGVSRVELSGRLADLFGDNPSFDLTLALKNIETELLAAVGAVPAALRTSGQLDGHATLNGSSENFIYSTDLIFDKVNLEEPGVFAKNAGSPMKIVAKGTVTAKSNITLDSLNLAMGGFSATGDGQIHNAGAPEQKINLRLTTNEFTPADLLSHFPAAALPADLKTSGTLKMNLAYEGTTDKGEVSLKISGPSLDLTYGENFHKFAGTPFMLETSGLYSTPTAFAARSLSVTIARIGLSGSAAYTAVGDGSYQADIKSNSFPLEDIASLVPPAKSYDLKGKAHLTAHVNSGKKGLNYKTSIALEKAGLSYEQAHLTDLLATISASPESISIPALTGKLDGAAIKGSLKGSNLETTPAFTVDLTADVVDLSKLIPKESMPANNQKSKPLPPPVLVSPGILDKPLSTKGHLAIGKLTHEYFNAQKINFTWNLTDLTPELDRVNGNASLRTGMGAITKKIPAPKTKMGKLVFIPVNIVQKIGKFAVGAAKVPSFENVHFKEVIGDYSLQKGVLSLQKFDLNGSNAQANMIGSVELAATQRLNLKLTLRGESDLTAVHLKILGTLDDPKVGLDTAAQGKQIFEAIKGGAADTLLEHLGLPGLGPRTKSTESQNPAPSNPPANDQNGTGTTQATPEKTKPDMKDLQKAGEDLLKGLFKK